MIENGVRAFALSIALLVHAWGPSTAAEPAGESVVAIWDGGQVDREEYLDWLLANGLEDEPSAVRELVLVQSLAAASMKRLDPSSLRSVDLEVEGKRHLLLVSLLRDQVLAGAASVDPKEIEAWLETHPDAFVRPLQLRLRNLFVALDELEQEEEIRAEVEEIHRQLVGGADFGDLARQRSRSQSRFRDGRLGLVDPNDLPLVIAAVVRDLKPGELSAPVQHPGGWTIFLCEEVLPERRPTPEEVRRRLRARLEKSRGKKRWKELQDELLEGVVVDLELVPHLSSGRGRSDGAPLRMPGDRLELEDLRLLVGLRWPDRELEDLTAPEVETLLRDWALGVAGARRAIERGLVGRDGDDGVAARLRWSRTEVLARRELVWRVDARLEEPEEEDLRRWYEAHTDRYREFASYELAGIQFDEAEGIAAIREVARRVKEADSLEGAAREYSRHASANDSGYLGWYSVAKLVDWGPTGARAIKALEPGQTTDLLRLESGLWVFRLLDQRERGVKAFEEVRTRVARELRAHRIEELEADVRAEQLKTIRWRVLGEPALDSVADPIVLTWSTASEHERFGYHVYRASQEEGPFERLTDEVVGGGGTTDVPRHYKFEDAAVEAGETYYYYVESVSTHGITRRLTPVIAIEAGAETLGSYRSGEGDPVGGIRSEE